MHTHLFSSRPVYIAVFLSIVSLITVTGCNDDDTTATQTSSIEGNWKTNSLRLNGTVDVLPSLTATYGSCLTDITLSFRAGGAVSYDNPASCTASAASIATVSAATGIDANSRWSQSGNVLTITPSASASTPRSFTTTFGTGTVQLQGSGLFAIPGTTAPPANYNFTLELRKL